MNFLLQNSLASYVEMKKKFGSPQTKIIYPKTKKAKPRPPRRMSRKEKIQLFGLAFLFVTAIVIGIELSLMKRVVHEHAQIQTLDINTMTMTLKIKDQNEPKTIQWLKDTVFMIERTEVTSNELKPSMDIILWKKDSLFFSDKIFKITASPLKDLDCSNPESDKASCTVK